MRQLQRAVPVAGIQRAGSIVSLVAWTLGVGFGLVAMLASFLVLGRELGATNLLLLAACLLLPVSGLVVSLRTLNTPSTIRGVLLVFMSVLMTVTNALLGIPALVGAILLVVGSSSAERVR